VELPQAHVARAAAYLITMAEGGALHLDRLRKRAADYDPDTRERLMAGALLPAQWLMKAQKFRRAYRDAVLALLRDVDVILAPATPCAAPLLGQKKFTLDGVELNVRANVGVYTQPISFIGLPVVVAPIWLPGAKMPLGVQIIAAPWREDAALRVAAALETLGAASARIAN
jgi:aspartyl-tRNA(Asn)/glutamyl-tRNA(Gln) amidotransferase subunit A